MYRLHFSLNGPYNRGIISGNMQCPDCQGERFAIRNLNGFELLMFWMTRKRKYLCMACGLTLRAPDRRKTPRIIPSPLDNGRYRILG